MILYDFKCNKCFHVFEEFFDNDSSILCPKCLGQVTKQLSKTANYTGQMTKAVNRRLDRLGAEGQKYKD